MLSAGAPPEMTGGVSVAQHALWKALRGRGADARLFTFNSRPVAGVHDDDTLHHREPDLVRWLIDRLSYPALRLIGARGMLHQVPYILHAALGAARANRSIKRFAPDAIILSDHGAPGLFIDRPVNGRILLVSHHNPARFLGNPLFGPVSERDVKLAMKLERRVLRKVDHVICPSAYMKDVFKNTYQFGGPVSVIPNTLDLEEIDRIPAFDVRRELALAPDAPVVYVPSAGRVTKGARLVPEIVRRLGQSCSPPIGFYLSGHVGVEQSADLRRAPANVRLYAPGHVEWARNVSVLKACTFCLSPTLLENYGMAVLEACSCGLPAVTFDTGGMKEMIDDGKNGFVVPYLDIGGLLQAAERMLVEGVTGATRDTTRAATRNKIDPARIADEVLSFC